MNFLKQWNGRELEIRSPLPLDECVSRLDAATSKFSIFGDSLRQSKPLIGRVTRGKLNVCKRNWYSNSFQICFSGTLREADGGTVISGRLAMALFVRIFTPFWFAGAFGMGAAFTTLAGTDPKGPPIWVGLLFTLGMLTFGCVLVFVCRKITEGDDAFLTEFLLATTEGRVTASGSET